MSRVALYACAVAGAMLVEAPKLSAEDASEHTYRHALTGFSVTAPRGWKRIQPAKPAPDILASWSATGRNEPPAMFVFGEVYGGAADSPLTYVEMRLMIASFAGERWTNVAKEESVAVNGIPAARFMMDDDRRLASSPEVSPALTYCFTKALNSKESIAIELAFVDRSGHLPQLHDAIDEALETVRFE